MTMAAYPFFKDVVLEFGRLFQLQEDVASMSIRKRMKASYGERRRVEVATSAVLSSLKAWNVIIPAERRSYKRNTKVKVENEYLQSFIIIMLLELLERNSLHMDEIQNHPLLFPFEVNFKMVELRKNKELAFFNQGSNELVVER